MFRRLGLAVGRKNHDRETTKKPQWSGKTLAEPRIFPKGLGECEDVALSKELGSTAPFGRVYDTREGIIQNYEVFVVAFVRLGKSSQGTDLGYTGKR